MLNMQFQLFMSNYKTKIYQQITLEVIYITHPLRYPNLLISSIIYKNTYFEFIHIYKFLILVPIILIPVIHIVNFLLGTCNDFNSYLHIVKSSTLLELLSN